MQVSKMPQFLGSLAVRLKQQDGGREVYKILSGRLGFSKPLARRTSRAVKIAASPIVARQRFDLNVLKPGDAVRVPDDKCWLKLPPGAVEGSKDVASHCRSLFEKKKTQLKKDFKPPYAPVLTLGEDLSIADPEEYRPIIDFCAQKSLFDLISEYVGEWPVISSIGLVYTPASTGVSKGTSQNYHRDMNHSRQLHLIMPIMPVTKESGPFTFLPGDVSDEIVAATGHEGGRLADEQVLTESDKNKLIYCTGEPGTVYLVDPYACIHCGARTKSKDRLLMIINFTSLFEASEGLRSICRAPNRHLLDNGSRESRLLLNLR